MRKHFALPLALMLSLLIASSSMASIIYTGYLSPGTYDSASLGTIKGSSEIAKEALNGLTGDGQGLFTFQNVSGAKRLLVVEQSATPGVYDKGLFFDYTKPDWNAAPVVNKELTNINTFRGAAQLGNAIYVAGYGAGASGSVVKFSTANDAYTAEAVQSFTSLQDGGINLHAETIAVYDGSVFVVVSREKGFKYKNNLLLKLSAADLTITASADLKTQNRDGQNTFILNGSDLYISSDPYGLTHQIEKISLAKMTSELLLSDSVSKDGYAYNSLLLTPDNSVYISASTFDSVTYGQSYKLYKTTLAKLDKGELSSADLIKENSGAYVLPWLAYDPESKLVWTQQGKLFAYDGGKFVNDGYAEDVLGCLASIFIPVSNLGGGNPSGGGDGGSGGCSAGAYGLLMLLGAVPLVLRRKR